MTQEEFEHIAPRLRELMLSVGHSFFGNDDDAEDVAQEGLVALLRFIDRMEPGIRHDALAIRVAKHCCMDKVRKRKASPFVSAQMNEGISPPGRDVGASPQEQLLCSQGMVNAQEFCQRREEIYQAEIAISSIR